MHRILKPRNFAKALLQTAPVHWTPSCCHLPFAMLSCAQISGCLARPGSLFLISWFYASISQHLSSVRSLDFYVLHRGRVEAFQRQRNRQPGLDVSRSPNSRRGQDSRRPHSCLGDTAPSRSFVLTCCRTGWPTLRRGRSCFFPTVKAEAVRPSALSCALGFRPLPDPGLPIVGREIHIE